MSANECRCGRPTRDVAYVCETCCEDFKKVLGDVPFLEDELTITITKQRGVPTEPATSPGAETALPWHEKAADARRHLKTMLVLWSRFCEEEGVRHRSTRTRPLDAHDDHPKALSAWLLWRVDGLALLDIGPDAYDEISDAVAQCRRIIDRRPDRWYAGPCDCGVDLYATSREGMVDCRTCDLRWDVAERRKWLLDEAEDRLANAATVARAVSWLGAEPLTASTVRKWAERGHIIAKGHEGRSPLYRVGDAIDLLARGAEAS